MGFFQNFILLCLAVLFFGGIIWSIILFIFLELLFFLEKYEQILALKKSKLNTAWQQLLDSAKKIIPLRGSKLKEVKIGETLIFAGVVIVFPYAIVPLFAFIANLTNNDDLYKFGGALQGISAPFSAGIAAILTFIAFWTQYSANKITIKEYQKQEKNSRFYEMLKIHKENVSELKFEIFILKSDDNNNIDFSDVPSQEKKGREIFHYYNIEISFLYKFICIIDKVSTGATPAQKKAALVKAYNIFYKKKFQTPKEEELISNISEAIHKSSQLIIYRKIIHDTISKSSYEQLQKQALYNLFETLWKHKLFFGKQKPFIGHFVLLNHYYRHLYLTVKLVAEANDLSYNSKRDLLRILRAQLTNEEQLMLFYNWLSGNGYQWEAIPENKNKENVVQNNYFSRYRMIHNIYPGDTVFCSANDEKEQAMQFIQNFKAFCIEENLPPKMCLKKEFDYDNDVIFQFEDWYDKGTLGFTYPQKESSKNSETN